MKEAPKIESRTAQDFVKEIRTRLIPLELPNWLRGEEQDWPAGDPGAALVEIFARFMTIISERLNRVPEKNFLAFLEMIGVSLRPPKAARVPVRFFFSTGSTQEAVVPQGTPLASTEAEPQAFQTEKALTVIPAALVEAITYDPDADSYTEHAGVDKTADNKFQCFKGKTPIEHSLYLKQDTVFRIEHATELTLEFSLDNPAADFAGFFGDLTWCGWRDDNGEYISLLKPSVVPDGQKINVTFTGTSSISNLKTWEVKGEKGYWLRATSAPLYAGDPPKPLKVPTVVGILSTANLNSLIELHPDGVFLNSTAADLTKGGFFPFGDRPKLDDAFYIGSSEVFSKASSKVTISVVLSFPVNESGTILPVTLRWEYWDGSIWQPLAETTNATVQPNLNDFTDSSKAFTLSVTPIPGPPTITFTCPNIAAKKENGVESHWLRVRIIGGNYGEDAKLIKKPGSTTNDLGNWEYQAATFRPPFITTLTLSFTYTEKQAMDKVMTYNDFAYELAETASGNGGFTPFTPFKVPEAKQPALYLGFDKPLPNRPVSLFLNVDEQKEIPATPSIIWEYWNGDVPDTFKFTVITKNGDSLEEFDALTMENVEAQINNQSEKLISVKKLKSAASSPDNRPLPATMSLENPSSVILRDWASQATLEITANQQGLALRVVHGTKWSVLGVQDETKNLTQPGMMEFIGPVNHAQQSHFGISRYWLRARLAQGENDRFSLAGVFPNSVWAVNAVTVQNEVFGSSTASPGQIFKLIRTPILEGQAIEVRELETPPPEDRQTLEQEGEINPVSVMRDPAGKPKDIWVRWHSVEHFYLSGPSSRHYVLDRSTGQIRFGNGVNGMIPPPGRDNLRAARYQSGGGKQGNVAAHTVSILKRAVPHIDRIDNPFPAGGGSDQESLEEVKKRGPLTLKHRNRAVSVEDYEWLAQESSLQVARACCLPAEAKGEKNLTPGQVQLIIVPDSHDPKPSPASGLINQVQGYIDARRIQTAKLEIIPPKYVDISVTATVIPKSLGESELVRRRIVDVLNAFLHPLTGGPDKEGWAFGRDAYVSEFAALIEGIDGVDYIKKLYINNQNIVEIADGYLAATGIHDITMESAQKAP